MLEFWSQDISGFDQCSFHFRIRERFSRNRSSIVSIQLQSWFKLRIACNVPITLLLNLEVWIYTTGFRDWENCEFSETEESNPFEDQWLSFVLLVDQSAQSLSVESWISFSHCVTNWADNQNQANTMPLPQHLSRSGIWSSTYHKAP